MSIKRSWYKLDAGRKYQLELLISILLMAWIAVTVDIQDVFASLQNYDTKLIISLIGLSLVQGLGAYIRWIWILRLYGINDSKWTLFRIYTHANFVNHLVPSTIVGDYLRYRGVTKPSSSVLASIIVDRLANPISLVGCWLLFIMIPAQLSYLLTAPLALTIVGISGYCWFRSVWAISIAASIAINIVTSAIFTLALAVDIAPIAVPLLKGLPLFLLSLCIPISFNGWGLRESSAMLIYADHLGPDRLVAAGLVMGMVSLLAAMILGITTLTVKNQEP